MIKKILKNYEQESIWFYLKDDDTKQKFLDELIAMDAHWNDGDKVEVTHHISEFMAVHDDYSIAFISVMAWSMSFQMKKEYIHIDYSKSCELNKIIEIKESNIKYVKGNHSSF